MDRLPAIDQDLAAVEHAHFEVHTESGERVRRAMEQAMGRPSRLSFKCAHTPPQKFEPGKAVALMISVQDPRPASVRLRYRRVNQAERWQWAEMEREGRSFQASIPAPYTQSQYGLEYYFELRQGPTEATLYPGFNEVFANQPYYVLARA